MNFDFSDDLKALREQARKFLRERCPAAAVRRVLEGAQPYDLGLWKEIAAMGWTGAAIPEGNRPVVEDVRVYFRYNARAASN